MSEFYRNVWEKKRPKGKHYVTLELMVRGELRPGGSRPEGSRGLSPLDAPRDYRKPYYWAAFVLSGDGR